MKRLPDIFDYQCFSAFLGDYLKAKRALDPKFSVRRLSVAMKFRSPSLISMVANGRRTPRPDFALALAKGLGLDDKAAEYAETLASLARAQTTDAQKKLEGRLRRLAPAPGVSQVDHDVFDLIGQWHNIALLEFTESKHFREDPEWLAECFGPTVSPTMVTESFELLLRLGLLVRTDDGRLVRSANHFKAANGIPSAAIRNFHKQMLLKAHHAVDRHKFDEKSFVGTTLTVPADKLELAETLLNGYMEDFRRQMTDGEQGKAKELYHVAFQFFRLTTAPLGQS